MQRNARGFTLIEVMVTLAIAALLLTVGIPSFSDAMQRHRVSTAIHLLSTHMAVARSSAVMRRTQIVVCPGMPGIGCRADGDWTHGWIVFQDDDKDRQPDASTDLLRVGEPIQGAQSTFAITSTRPYLRYQADGRSAHSNLTVRFCAAGEERGRVIVNNTGRVRSERSEHGPGCV